MEVPSDVKKNVRSVLLSKIGGVPVADFLRDYKSLLQKPLYYKNLGFDKMMDFIKAMPDVVRLEFDDQSMAYKMFGIGDSKMYMSGSAKKAERGCGGTSDPAHVMSGMKTSAPVSNGHVEFEGKLNPNSQGLYTVCYPRAKETRGFSEDDVVEKFSEFGGVEDVNMIPGLIFIRYRDRQAAVNCLLRHESGLGMKIADEKKPKSAPRPEPRNSGDAHKTLVQKKAQSHHSRGRVIEVYIGNISQNVSKEQLTDLVEPFSPKDLRMITPKGDPRKVFAFVDFRTDQESNALEAIQELNQKQWEGRKLNVRLAQEEKPSFERTTPRGQGDGVNARGDNKPSSWPKKTQMPAPEEEEDEWGEEPDSKTQTATTLTTITPGSSLATTSLNNKTPNSGLSAQMAALSVNTSSPTVYNRSPVISPQEVQPMISPIRTPTGPASVRHALFPSPVKQTTPPSRDVNVNASVYTSPGRNTNANTGKFQEVSPLNTSQTYDMPRQQPVHRLQGMPKLEGINSHEGMPKLEPINSYEGMPSLEPINSYEGMPKLELINNNKPSGMRPLEPIHSNMLDNNERPVMLFLGNFVYMETEYDIARLFAPYGVRHVEIRNNMDRRKTTSAVVTVANMEMATRARLELDQTYYRNRRLLVCLAKEDPAYEPAIQFTSPYNLQNIKCTIGSHGASPRNVTLGEESLGDMQRGRGRNFPMGGVRSRMSSTSSSASSQETTHSETRIIKKTFNSLLMTYNIIMTKLGARRHDLAFNSNDELTVYVTSVFDDQHFWGQVIQDEGTLSNLNMIMTDLQSIETRIGGTKGLGRCAAQYDNEWFRGWITAERPGFMVDVFFVDYGNTSMMNKSQTSLTVPEVWEVKAMVRPFRITEGSIPLTKEMAEKIVILRVNRVCVDDTRYLTEVQITSTP